MNKLKKSSLRIVDGYVPVVDLSGTRGEDFFFSQNSIAETIAQVCEVSGFFVIANHGVSEDAIRDVYEATRAFFHLPAEEKRRSLADPDDPLMKGFGFQGNLAAPGGEGETAVPDLSETFTFNRLGDDGAPGLPAHAVAGIDLPNRWPDVRGFESAYRRYYAEMEVLAATIMRLFAIGLGLREDWFSDFVRDHMTNLTANYYPPQLGQPLPGQLRKGMHSDWGALTILYQDSDVGGLEVRDSSGQWWKVPALPGTFVVNIGDLMSRWTGDKWVSTMHRVVNPPEEQRNTERYSLPFFFQPRFDSVIERIPTCPPGSAEYPSTKSGDYLLSRLSVAYDLAHK